MSDERLGHATRGEAESQARPRRQTAELTRGPSLDERLAAYRSEMYSNVLPTLPKIPGWHVCWVSMTNQNDSVARRESQGYERVKPEDLPGFDHVTVTSGPFQGCIVLNEMIAMKVPLEQYYGQMQIAHSERPQQHQDKMRQQLGGIVNNGDGVKVELADGSQSFMRDSAKPRPQFTE